MTEQEIIEVWRKEFEPYCAKLFFGATLENVERHWCGTKIEYDHLMIQNYWGLWLAAKRSQPVVQLPEAYYIPTKRGEDVFYSKYDVLDALAAAGIQTR